MFVSLVEPTDSSNHRLPGGTTNRVTASSTHHFLIPSGRVFDNHSVHNSRLSNNSAVGYWIARAYGGQMTRAIRNMMQLQCLARALSESLRVVEPFARGSDLLHSPSVWGGHSARFSNYYNLSYYNHMSKTEEGAPLVTWEEFFDLAPREVIILRTPIKPCTMLTSASELSGLFLNGSLQNPKTCSFPSDILDDLLSFNFSVIKTICIDCTHLLRALEPNELKQFVYGDRDISEVTLVTNFLSHYEFIKSWVNIPQFCRTIEHQHSDVRLIPSLSVVRHTENYLTTLHGNRTVTTIAVMFRFERYFEQHQKSEDGLMECLNETVKVYDKLKQQYSNSNVFITLDIGRFGSIGMQKDRIFRNTGIVEEDMYSSIYDTLQYLSDDHWSMEKWEEHFVRATGGITDRGYIAMLQQSIAAHSDCLILVGGGGYQQVAASQYINKHGRTCIHTVCMLEQMKKIFSWISTT